MLDPLSRRSRRFRVGWIFRNGKRSLAFSESNTLRGPVGPIDDLIRAIRIQREFPLGAYVFFFNFQTNGDAGGFKRLQSQ